MGGCEVIEHKQNRPSRLLVPRRAIEWSIDDDSGETESAKLIDSVQFASTVEATSAK
jgi:hypothetical protein